MVYISDSVVSQSKVSEVNISNLTINVCPGASEEEVVSYVRAVYRAAREEEERRDAGMGINQRMHEQYRRGESIVSLQDRANLNYLLMESARRIRAENLEPRLVMPNVGRKTSRQRFVSAVYEKKDERHYLEPTCHQRQQPQKPKTHYVPIPTHAEDYAHDPNDCDMCFLDGEETDWGGAVRTLEVRKATRPPAMPIGPMTAPGIEYLTRFPY